ncbi:MAG: alpha/beta fold hydrolase [Chloroflexi bacterium]|nr:alpha/beta fold hydrolase [Chloroflexota bacterium]
MRSWCRVALAAGLLVGAAWVAPRLLWFRRRPLPEGFQRERLDVDSVGLAVARHYAARDRAIIVAHGLLKTMNSPSMVRTLRGLSRHMDVVAFDFPGHGYSDGACDLDFRTCAHYLAHLVEETRSRGYRRVAVIGHSMGAAAAILAAAHGAPLDAVVAVSPPALAIGKHTSNSWSIRWLRPWARFMGTCLAERLAPGPWPVEYVADVSPIPLLIIHNGLDTLFGRENTETLYAIARPPKGYLHIPLALHADSVPSLERIVAWLDKFMP